MLKNKMHGRFGAGTRAGSTAAGVLVVFALCSFDATARHIDTPTSTTLHGIVGGVSIIDSVMSVADSTRAKRGRLALLPIIFSSPDTRLAFGVLPQYIFRISPDSRPSSVRIDAFYTLNKQFSVQLTPQVWLAANRYRIGGKCVFKEWPTSYYGIGGKRSTFVTGDADSEKFTERLLSVSAEVQRQLRPGLFAGISYAIRHARIEDIEPGGELATAVIAGSGKGTASGVGIIVSWDTRDNVYFPTTGSLHTASVALFDGTLGSDYEFGSFGLDLRHYLGLHPRHVISVQAAASIRTGRPPFRMLPGLGETLRGYSTTRYIDQDRLALQAEYRFVPVWWRIGFAVFAGVGDTAPRMGDFDLKDPKYAFGFGIRGVAFRSEMITVRFDFGFGKDSSGDYLDLNEAF